MKSPPNMSERTTYSFGVRLVHWFMARIGLIQSICLLMWIGERANREKEPPVHPWIIYTHALIGLIASTGISARFLTYFSLTLLCLSEIHMAWLFMFQSKLGYEPYVRARIGLRCLASFGIYLRLLGINHNSYMTITDTNNENDNSKSGEKRDKFKIVNYVIIYSNYHNFGSICLSISTCLLGLSTFPNNIIQIDSDIQLKELSSLWSIFCKYEFMIHLILGLLLIIGCFCYSIPLIIMNNDYGKYLLSSSSSISIFPSSNVGIESVPATSTSSSSSSCLSLNPIYYSYVNNLFYFGDVFTFFGFIVITLLHDLNFDYWYEKTNYEYWLIMKGLFENLTIVLGILIINHLLIANFHSKSKQNCNSSLKVE